MGTEVPVLQTSDSEMSVQGKHHTMNGEECFRIITLSKEADRQCFIWQVALLDKHLKGRILRRKKRKPCVSVGTGTPTQCSRKDLPLKEYPDSLSKAGWLATALGEKNQLR